MNLLIIVTALDLIITWKFIGLNIVSILATVTWVLFAGRRFGYFCKVNVILALECLGLFFMVTYQLLTKNFIISKIVLALLLRALFFAVVKYDATAFVYVTEEKRDGID